MRSPGSGLITISSRGRFDTFKISNDPRFEDKLVDVVGLYLNPPARAVVFSYYEKTQCQALDRTQPSLPIKGGRAGTMTHDCKRNGTIDVRLTEGARKAFRGDEPGYWRSPHDTQKRHAAADVLRFFKQIDASVPRPLAVHVILDNLSAHSAPEITTWLAHRDRRRWHLHFTPTSRSWLNLIEGWFKELTDKRLRRGRFTSVAELTEAITTWAEHWNTDPKPLIWKATAQDIIAKVQRGRDTLHQIKSNDGPLARPCGVVAVLGTTAKIPSLNPGRFSPGPRAVLDRRDSMPVMMTVLETAQVCTPWATSHCHGPGNMSGRDPIDRRLRIRT